jgi:MoaA/NifB/PqqE/SkfB family radical SAM enzyme
MRAKIKPRIDLENRTKLETVIPLRVPFIINVDPTDVCNFQCKFCPTGDRALMRNTPGRNAGLMDFDLFSKIVDDICEFETPIRVLRLYKDGEPLLHPKFPEMVRYAKDRKCSDRIDTTTNGSRLTPELNLRLADAGLDRINISIYGLNDGQYKDFSKAKVNFDTLVSNIRHLYERRGSCEMIVKINGDLLSKDQEQNFYDVFGDIADGVFVEHIMSCWPEFELETHGVNANANFTIYGQPISEVEVCPYIFYSFSINSDGAASSCFLDWERKLIIGDARTQSVKDIWTGAKTLAHQKMMLMKERKQHPVCRNCDQMRRGHPDKIDEFADTLLEKVAGLETA